MITIKFSEVLFFLFEFLISDYHLLIANYTTHIYS